MVVDILICAAKVCDCVISAWLAVLLTYHIKLCLLLWLHFSKTVALLFVIFFGVFRYSFRPPFGYDRQIVVDSILILSRGKRRNYV